MKPRSTGPSLALVLVLGAIALVTLQALGPLRPVGGADDGAVGEARVGDAGLDASLARGQDSVDRLDPSVRRAVRRAAQAARRDGVVLVLNSGWRSRSHQQRLWDEALATHGSVREASRLVATPDDSTHVTGAAVDIGPPQAADWLDRKGARFGLCRTFANEAWHFERVADSRGRCPDQLPDASAQG